MAMLNNQRVDEVRLFMAVSFMNAFDSKWLKQGAKDATL